MNMKKSASLFQRDAQYRFCSWLLPSTYLPNRYNRAIYKTKQSGACDPLHDGPSTRYDHRVWPYASENHDILRACAYLVDMCASLWFLLGECPLNYSIDKSENCITSSNAQSSIISSYRKNSSQNITKMSRKYEHHPRITAISTIKSQCYPHG